MHIKIFFFYSLNDGPSGRMNRGRSRSRSRSRNNVQITGSIQDRLGNRRMRMRRGPPANNNNNNNGAAQRSRSRSRVRLNRNNFRNNSNAAPFKRSNSINARLGRNGPALAAATTQNPQTRQRRFRSQTRNNNANKNNANNVNKFNRPLTGRIIKRSNLKNGGVTKQVRRPNTAGNAIRNAQKFKR